MEKYVLLFEEWINEKAITFNNVAFPKEGQIVIMCGGAGSGKSTALKKAFAIDAKVLDIDATRQMMNQIGDDTKWGKMFKQEYGRELSSIDLTNPNDTDIIHKFTKKLQLSKKKYMKVFDADNNATTHRTHLDNFIFDVTLKNYPKLKDIADLAELGGYDPKNIHIVWVLNDYETSLAQNNTRARRLDANSLKSTHLECAEMVRKIFNNENNIQSLAQGDYWIYFGSTNTGDVTIQKSGRGGEYMSDFNAVKIKNAGKEMLPYEKIMELKVRDYKKNDDGTFTRTDDITLRDKINKYIPKESERF